MGRAIGMGIPFHNFGLNSINFLTGVGDSGLGGAAALPTLGKFANMNHNRAENRPKVGQNCRKKWIFYQAAPL